MTPSFDWLTVQETVFGLAGIAGLMILALAAARMSRETRGWGPRLIAVGAVVLLLARIHHMVSPLLLPPEVIGVLGRTGVTLCLTLPPVMLTVGLLAVVWGLWGHGRELARAR